MRCHLESIHHNDCQWWRLLVLVYKPILTCNMCCLIPCLREITLLGYSQARRAGANVLEPAGRGRQSATPLLYTQYMLTHRATLGRVLAFNAPTPHLANIQPCGMWNRSARVKSCQHVSKKSLVTRRQCMNIRCRRCISVLRGSSRTRRASSLGSRAVARPAPHPPSGQITYRRTGTHQHVHTSAQLESRDTHGTNMLSHTILAANGLKCDTSMLPPCSNSAFACGSFGISVDPTPYCVTR